MKKHLSLIASGLLAMLGAQSMNAGEILGQKGVGLDFVYYSAEGYGIDVDGYGAAIGYDTPWFDVEGWGSADLNFEFLYAKDDESYIDLDESRLLAETTLYRPTTESLSGFLKLGLGYAWTDATAILGYTPDGTPYATSVSENYYFFRAGIGLDWLITENIGSYAMAYYEDYEDASGEWFFEAGLDCDITDNAAIRSSINYSDVSGMDTFEYRLGYYHKF